MGLTHIYEVVVFTLVELLAYHGTVSPGFTASLRVIVDISRNVVVEVHQIRGLWGKGLVHRRVM